MNLIYYLTGKCPECENTTFKKDFKHQEVYCSRCGLIVQDNELITRKNIKYMIKNNL
ncbi:MAG: hypothetical protein E7Z73_05900 [Methanobrevibacter millerae]|uniref:TFIIB-type domain-containing protein n=1 Tax=Methanobrevibacter millerae TaxID=230361 RepID=A0A8T3VB79_9EURY|nr:hypothetical protein [Methanobrevibacter millerae]